jgi:hypothetical protein
MGQLLKRYLLTTPLLLCGNIRATMYTLQPLKETPTLKVEIDFNVPWKCTISQLDRDINLTGEELLSAVYGNGDSSLGVLPPGTRWFSRDMTEWVVERPPAYISILYQPASKGTAFRNTGTVIPVRLPVPWQIYKICMRGRTFDFYAYFANEPMQDETHLLHAWPLGNMRSGKVCVASQAYERYSKMIFHSTAEKIQWIIQSFWVSGFNNSTYNFNGATPSQVVKALGLSNSSYFVDASSRIYEYLESLSLVDVINMDLKQESDQIHRTTADLMQEIHPKKQLFDLSDKLLTAATAKRLKR